MPRAADSRLTSEQIDRRIGRSAPAKRAFRVAGVGWVGTFLAIAALTFAAIVEWWPGVVVAAAALLASLTAVTVSSLVAARAVGISLWRSVRFALASLRRAVCAVLDFTAGV